MFYPVAQYLLTINLFLIDYMLIARLFTNLLSITAIMIITTNCYILLHCCGSAQQVQWHPLFLFMCHILIP